MAATLAFGDDSSTKFQKDYVDPTLRQIESAAHGVAAPSASFGPAAKKATQYVNRFLDPISEALEFHASKAAAALGSSDVNASAPPEPALSFPDPLEFLKATFFAAPEPLAKPEDFSYKPPPEKRADSTRLVRGRAGAARPRLRKNR